MPEHPEESDPLWTLERLLGSPTIASKAWVVRQYDSTIRASTVLGPGPADAAVVRLRGTPKALALKTDVSTEDESGPEQVPTGDFELKVVRHRADGVLRDACRRELLLHRAHRVRVLRLRLTRAAGARFHSRDDERTIGRGGHVFDAGADRRHRGHRQR